MIRGRFAPTPSGPMHLGNIYTALLSYLQTRSAGGEYILRIEDIDLPRSKPHWTELILEDLRWLGLHWDEGPDVGGAYHPYVQSKRLDIYEDAFRKLQEQHTIYPCYCSRAELMSLASAPHGLASEGPVYLGTCRHLSDDERTKRAETKSPSFRFAVPQDVHVSFIDGCMGPQHYPPGAGGDFVVKRADGIYAYQLAVVVDDAAMEITDVLRGADLLDSTPRQIWLYEALGTEPPRFAHVPPLCDAEGERLSKRHRSLAVSALREAGCRPESIIGVLAWASGLMDRPEPVKPDELISEFSLAKLPREPIRLPPSAIAALMQGG